MKYGAESTGLVSKEALKKMNSLIFPVPLGAIDIGSNAIRLILAELDAEGHIRPVKKVREPVRLGKDVFATGEVTKKTAERAIQSFKKFRSVLKNAGVTYMRAVATSAMREAKNRQWFVDEVAKETGIKIDVISGGEEARLIYTAVAERVNLEDETALLIDIGGGSVELTLVEDTVVKASKTFKLGTVRLLQMLEDRGLKEKQFKSVIQEQFAPARAFLKEACKGKQIDVCVGTGGNFECLGKLRVALLNRTSIFSMTSDELSHLIKHLSSMSVKERIQFLRLRPDRADVVIPAALVTEQVMSAMEIDTLQIPYVGLRDGLLSDLASRIKLP